MARYLVALVAVIGFSFVSATASATQKGFFIGGGLVNRAATGDLDGESLLTTEDLDRSGSIGKLDAGSGLVFDIGYNFTNRFGLEYLETTTLHTAKHDLETKETDAVVRTGLVGVRLSAGLADAFDFFARAGLAIAAVTYERYGHKGSFGPTFAPTSDEDFTLAGAGAGYGIGAEAIFRKHLGIGIGFTVYKITFDEGSIGSTKTSINKNKPSATFATTDVTVLWHF